MRAKFIYEKFEQESDPIHDLGIGKLNLNDDFNTIYGNIKRKAAQEWIDFLKKTLVGKTLMGEFQTFENGRWGGFWNRKIMTITIISIEEIPEDISEHVVEIKGRQNKIGRLKRYKINLKNQYQLK